MENKDVWNLSEILKHISDSHDMLFDWFGDQDSEKWTEGPQGKWTAGQHLIHLIQSEKPLNKALGLPKFVLKWKFGTANRPIRNYETVVEKYQTKLKAVPEGVVSPFSINMPVSDLTDKPTRIEELKLQKDILLRNAGKWSEDDLDHYIIPHPLLGKMPVREMLMWTSCHIRHHLNILQEKYQ